MALTTQDLQNIRTIVDAGVGEAIDARVPPMLDALEIRLTDNIVGQVSEVIQESLTMIGEKFEAVDQRFDAIDERLNSMDSQLHGLTKDMKVVKRMGADHNYRLTRVELHTGTA